MAVRYHGVVAGALFCEKLCFMCKRRGVKETTAWFLEIAFSDTLVCVHVCPSLWLLITAHEMKLYWPIKQVLQFSVLYVALGIKACHKHLLKETEVAQYYY